jgi:hypothetical protein
MSEDGGVGVKKSWGYRGYTGVWLICAVVFLVAVVMV